MCCNVVNFNIINTHENILVCNIWLFGYVSYWDNYKVLEIKFIVLFLNNPMSLLGKETVCQYHPLAPPPHPTTFITPTRNVAILEPGYILGESCCIVW